MSKRTFLKSRHVMEEFLKQESIGYLGLSRAGKPYVIPLNYSYSDGKIIFHCALQGKKLDYIKANPNVCFAVGKQMGEVREHADGNFCHLDSDSVICYGTARAIEDLKEREMAINSFNRRFRPDAPDILLKRVENCGLVEIKIREMTGRRERKRKKTYWRYIF